MERTRMFSRKSNTRLERADAAFHDVDLHAGLALHAVQRVDGLLVHDGVDLDLNPCFLACARRIFAAGCAESDRNVRYAALPADGGGSTLAHNRTAGWNRRVISCT